MPLTIATLLAVVSVGIPGEEPPLDPESPFAEFQPSFVPPAERNAAIAHGLAWAMYTGDLKEQLANVPLRRGELPQDWTPDEALTAALESSQWLIEPVLSAASMPYCDFHLAREKGVSLLLPHIGWLNQDVKFLLADARRLEREEKHAQAAERLAGVFGIAHHLASDGITISAISSARYAGLAAREATRLAPRLNDEGRAALIEQLDRFEENDPFGHRASVVHTVEYTFANSALDIMNAKRENVGGFSGVSLPDEPTKPTTKEEHRLVAEQLKQSRQWAGDVLSAWDAEDSTAALREVHRATRAGEYGELAKVGAVPLQSARRDAAAALQGMDNLRSSLQGEGTKQDDGD